jgi:hypothetical protein
VSTALSLPFSSESGSGSSAASFSGVVAAEEFAVPIVKLEKAVELEVLADEIVSSRTGLGLIGVSNSKFGGWDSDLTPKTWANFANEDDSEVIVVGLASCCLAIAILLFVIDEERLCVGTEGMDAKRSCSSSRSLEVEVLDKMPLSSTFSLRSSLLLLGVEEVKRFGLDDDAP